MTDVLSQQEPIRSTFPARLDRLGWSPSIPHGGRARCRVDPGRLQITIASSVTGVLASPDALGMTSTQIGLDASSTWSARSSARWSSAGCRTSWGGR